MATRRKEFPRSVKVAAIKRAMINGVVYCELCKLPAKKWEIDHVKEDWLGGEPTLENAAVACVECHKRKTQADAPVRAKTLRVEAAALGIKK